MASFLGEQRVVICATNGVRGWPHLMPLWYVVRERELWAWTYAKSQKALNLQRDARLTCLVEAGERYEELRGVQIKGRAVINDDRETVQRIGEDIYKRYTGGPLNDNTRQMVAAQAPKRVLVFVEPVEIVSWDHRKLGGVY